MKIVGTINNFNRNMSYSGFAVTKAVIHAQTTKPQQTVVKAAINTSPKVVNTTFKKSVDEKQMLKKLTKTAVFSNKCIKHSHKLIVR